jgi:hypothetical protein
MAITSIKTGSSFTNLKKYNDFLAGNEAYIPNNFESIATVTVGAGGTSSVTFSGIPSTYQHLQLRGIFRPTAASWIIALFNGDNGTNYQQHDLRGNGSSVTVEATTGADPRIYFILGAATASNTYAAGVMDILDYANTNKLKTTRSLNGIDTNGGGNIDLTSSAWRNTAAVSSIELKTNTGASIPEYSSFALYGIKE